MPGQHAHARFLIHKAKDNSGDDLVQLRNFKLGVSSGWNARKMDERMMGITDIRPKSERSALHNFPGNNLS